MRLNKLFSDPFLNQSLKKVIKLPWLGKPKKGWLPRPEDPVFSDSYCKICRRDYNWQYSYGVSPEEYYEMYKEQDGKCKICGCELEDEYLNIDHDSKTGEVRGLLCPNCNKGLGLFNEDINALKIA